MLFSSLVFLWYFLPAVCLLYFAGRSLRWRNALLLAVSLLFYGWGEPVYILLMILSILMNYGFGLWLGKAKSRAVMALCAAANLGLLGYFKYFQFFGELVNALTHRELIAVGTVVLPIGISFYTFQALSYVIDVYRGGIRPQKSPWKLALYISFFPQLIAGPIVKYHDIQEQLDSRRHSWDQMAYGIKRFSYGLGKKVIFANTFAAVADQAFAGENRGQISTGLAWAAVLFYTMQIYYDFSGYSDMAIGLGKMFGFDFMENFRYPYMAQSIREFWRRWHISLSTWFKEYLYIPLGGNRKGVCRTCLNLFFVFLATGLWHGAGMNFVLWGAYYGVFIVAERLFLGRILEKNPVSLLNRAYTLFVVYMGWLLFRVEDWQEIKRMIKVMFLGQGGPYTAPMFINGKALVFLALGIVLCGPLQEALPALKRRLYDENRITAADVAVMAVLTVVSVMLLVSSTYNPFIYFRF
ncbi:MAG: MBOAT family protein [Eubacteriales bacterium]|nr:MBOAT family protein [Eubacteriales bacterium]